MSGAGSARPAIVAFSSAGFFSSITPSGSPLTKITMSARRLCPCGPTTVNWLTASQSLLSGSSKSITRAGAPAIDPSARRYSTVTPSTSIRWTARLRSISDGPSARTILRKASSRASCGRSGFSRTSASRRRHSRTTSRYVGSLRSAPGWPMAMLGPWATEKPDGEPGQGSLFDGRLGERRAAHPAYSRALSKASSATRTVSTASRRSRAIDSRSPATPRNDEYETGASLAVSANRARSKAIAS